MSAVIILLLVLMMDGTQNILALIVADDRLERFLTINRTWYAIYWFVILYLLFANERTIEEKLGLCNIFSAAGDHSFYVYILHSIVLKSVVMVIFSITIHETGFLGAAMISTIFCVALTAIAAIFLDRLYKLLVSGTIRITQLLHKQNR